MAEDSSPLLDLETLIKRPKIKITTEENGAELYEIVSPDEISVLQYHRFGSGGRRLDELMALDQPSDDEALELRRLIRVLSDDIMAPVPEKIRSQLSDTQRLDVIEVFIALSLRKRARTAAAAAQGETLKAMLNGGTAPTGEKPSPGSNASTEATPEPGSKESRSPSSGAT